MVQCDPYLNRLPHSNLRNVTIISCPAIPMHVVAPRSAECIVVSHKLLLSCKLSLQLPRQLCWRKLEQPIQMSQYVLRLSRSLQIGSVVPATRPYTLNFEHNLDKTLKQGFDSEEGFSSSRACAYRIQNCFSTISTKILVNRYYFRDL